MTWIYASLAGAIPVLLGILVGSYLYNRRQVARVEEENAQIKPVIRKWEGVLTTLLGELPVEHWPTHLSLMRSDMRDVVGLPTYDGKPSEPNHRH